MSSEKKDRCIQDHLDRISKNLLSCWWESSSNLIITDSNKNSNIEMTIQCSGYISQVEIPWLEVVVLNEILKAVKHYCPKHPNFPIEMRRDNNNPKTQNLYHISHIGLFNKNLPHLPENIGNLSFLQSLKVRRNQLSTLPASFDRLHSLISLDIGENDFTIIPPVIVDFTHRKPGFSLSLSSNPFRSLWGFPNQAIYSISLSFTSGSKWDYENEHFHLTETGKQLVESCGSRKSIYAPDYDEIGGWFDFDDNALRKVQEYYAKSPLDLALQYVHYRSGARNVCPLSLEEKVRLTHEADLPIFHFLESKLLPADSVLGIIQLRLGSHMAKTIGIRL